MKLDREPGPRCRWVWLIHRQQTKGTGGCLICMRVCTWPTRCGSVQLGFRHLLSVSCWGRLHYAHVVPYYKFC